METKLVLIFFAWYFYNADAKSVILENQQPQNDKSADSSESNQKSCIIENQQIPHEEKCNLYYRCVYGIKICKECPNGMFFNTQTANCDSSYNVACGTLVTDKDTNKYYGDFSDYYGLEDNITPSNEECPVKEDIYEPNPLLPHEESCNAFYKCFNGKKYLMKCPGMLQFNPRVSACDWPNNVKCIDQRITTTTESRSRASSTNNFDSSEKLNSGKQ